MVFCVSEHYTSCTNERRVLGTRMVYFQSRKYSSLRPFSEILVAVASLTHSPFTKVQIKARNRARYIFIIVVFIYLELLFRLSFRENGRKIVTEIKRWGFRVLGFRVLGFRVLWIEWMDWLIDGLIMD